MSGVEPEFRIFHVDQSQVKGQGKLTVEYPYFCSLSPINLSNVSMPTTYSRSGVAVRSTKVLRYYSGAGGTNTMVPPEVAYVLLYRPHAAAPVERRAAPPAAAGVGGSTLCHGSRDGVMATV